jgi:uncharacterized protein (DUF885 family)
MRLRSFEAALFIALACSSACKKKNDQAASPPTAEAPHAVVSGNDVADGAFAAAADEFYLAWLKSAPTQAAGMGYHDYDGKLPDVSAAAIAADVAALKRSLATFEGFAGKLSAPREFEREVLTAHIRGELFQLDDLRAPMRNPMFYMWAIELSEYITRDYAPLADRARGLIGIAKGTGAYLDDAATNLQAAVPKTWLTVALMQVDGSIDFAKKDVVAAMKGLPAELDTELQAALADYIRALEGYQTALKQRLPAATEDYALGADTFLKMLAATEGLQIDMVALEEIGRADLQRNLAAFEAAAREIDGAKSPAAVADQVRAMRPPMDGVLAEATSQSADMRAFLIDHEIVSIPSDDVAELRESPPFLRWNFAFMSSPGMFEQRKLPAFYYISPPDPSWPKQKQLEYVPSKQDLLFTTIHEVWPGHFLHGLHIRKNESKILKSFCSYAMSEGWAHYTEEMMWDAGVGERDPAVHIGQLSNALLRNVRFMSAIGLHTKRMTVAESTKMFVEQGYQDEASAEQQAVRGTFDPGYLNYTLGKLMIRKLHDDWKAQQAAAYSLKGFHDTFLSHGCAPIPVIRRAMLGSDAGPAL